MFMDLSAQQTGEAPDNAYRCLQVRFVRELSEELALRVKAVSQSIEARVRETLSTSDAADSPTSASPDVRDVDPQRHAPMSE
jgi:hypothetical protein